MFNPLYNSLSVTYTFNLAKRRNIRKRISRSYRKARTNVKPSGLKVGRILKTGAKQSIAISVARRIIPNVAGSNQVSLDMVGAGGILMLLGSGGKNLVTAGASLFGANLLDKKVMPLAMGASKQVSQTAPVRAISNVLAIEG